MINNENEAVTKAVWDSGEYDGAIYPFLATNLTVDVAVVGGGITGVTAAYLLARAGKKVALLEATEIGKGTTGSSTGNLYIPVGQRWHTIKSKHSEKIMHAVAKSRSAAIDFIEEQVHVHQLDCAFERVPWHLFTRETTKTKDQEVLQEYEAAKQLHLDVQNTPPQNFLFDDVSAITTIHHQAQLNPLYYIKGLAKAVDSANGMLFEHSRVLEIRDGVDFCTVKTEKGQVFANHVVVATHSPIGIYAVHAAMEAHREYAVAAKLKTALPMHGIYWLMLAAQQYSIRPYVHEEEHYLLVLGESHLVGNVTDNEDRLKKIEDFLYQHFEVEQIVYRWAAQNYKPADGLPYIGKSLMEHNTYIATGFTADGLVYGTLAAKIISDEILGIRNEWASIYDPKRFTPLASAKQFLKENLNVGTHLVKDYLFYGEVKELKDIPIGEGKTLVINDEKVAAYRSVTGELHLVSSICTHMGCVVRWNRAEKSWDCPCHGSRFSVDGEILEGPAIKALAKPNR